MSQERALQPHRSHTAAAAIGAAILLAAFVMIAPPRAHAVSTPPNLAGRWILDHARSDNPQEKMREAMAGRRPGMGGGPRGGRWGGRGEGRPEGEGDGRRPGRMAAGLPDTMRVEQSPEEISIFAPDGTPRFLYLDGEKHTSTGPGGVEVEEKAAWKAGHLIVERKVGDRGKSTDDFELAADGATLTCTSTIHPPRGGEVSIRRVYARQ